MCSKGRSSCFIKMVCTNVVPPLTRSQRNIIFTLSRLSVGTRRRRKANLIGCVSIRLGLNGGSRDCSGYHEAQTCVSLRIVSWEGHLVKTRRQRPQNQNRRRVNVCICIDRASVTSFWSNCWI
uniref:Uncharacterized protein n=2 Tax=Cacopsylla melanoneura TaxID=428564 RepID=A0A8D8VS58_9HEMI